MSETSFQSYFLKTVPHGYRTSLINGDGFPDTFLDHGTHHSLVELKDLHIGPSGDKKLKGLFKKSQPPWYANYLSNGGERLFVVFKITKSDGQTSYGILHMTMEFVRELPELKYSQMFNHRYLEYKTLKELINAHFYNAERVGGSDRHRDEGRTGDK